MCPYRFAILAVVLALHPMIDATTESDAPRSRRRVQAVCLRSWKRLSTPALFFAAFQAVLISPAGLVGSIVFAWELRSLPANP